MMDSKYSKFLTVLLIIVILAIVGLLGFLGYDYYQKYFIDSDAKKFIEEYDSTVSENTDENNTITTEELSNVENPLDKIEQTEEATGNGSNKKITYKGFEVSGKIEIPKTNVEYPILSQVSKKSIETAVAIQYGPGPNQPGNTVIVGHNYRNGLFFSNNKKLSNGDIIYITDNSGKKLKYTIYNKYETTPEDTDYMIRDTNGAKEISLSTCTDDSKARLILWAKADS